MPGTLFDIQAFALHDGPGIRTTLFLKGCPLRCCWCSNPESFGMNPSLSHNRERCVDCLSCTSVCETGALTGREDRLQVEHALCNGCGDCVDVCPEDALKLYGYQEEASVIIKKIARDKPYFERSGGGITLSGGEAMLQSGFARELLMEAKKEGIHTCLETSGFARQEEYTGILPFVDLFLFDYKATGTETHRKLTGQNNDLILDNLAYLNREGARMILRCPLVPGINDTPEHFEAITRISNTMDGIEKVELMPYHNYGEHKYKQLGLKMPCSAEKNISALQLEEWSNTLVKMGCTKLKQTGEKI